MDHIARLSNSSKFTNLSKTLKEKTIQKKLLTLTVFLSNCLDEQYTFTIPKQILYSGSEEGLLNLSIYFSLGDDVFYGQFSSKKLIIFSQFY